MELKKLAELGIFELMIAISPDHLLDILHYTRMDLVYASMSLSYFSSAWHQIKHAAS